MLHNRSITLRRFSLFRTILITMNTPRLTTINTPTTIAVVISRRLTITFQLPAPSPDPDISPTAHQASH